jgi:hypothetical protein
MRSYLLGGAASLLALVGLAGSPSPARADHHDRGHQAWHHHHPQGHSGGSGWRSYYSAPYPRYYVAPSYGYGYPYYVPFYDYVYPGYGLNYQGPYFSFWIGR